MNKILIGFFLLLGVLVASVNKEAEAYGPGGGWNYTIVDVSSAVVFSGGGDLYRLVLSTGNNTDWCQAIDTQTIQGPAYVQFTSTQLVTPALIFYSTTTLFVDQSKGNGWGIGDGEYVNIRNGLFIWKSAVGSGRANQVGVYWRKN